MVTSRLSPISSPISHDPTELLLESATSFFIISGDITFNFHKDPTGALSLTLHAYSQTFEAKKIS